MSTAKQKPDRPKRIRLIHIPIYDTDTDFIAAIPAGSTSQWARGLLLRQLQYDAQAGNRGSEGMSVDEVKRLIHDELDPILETLDLTIDRSIEDKLTAVETKIIAAVKASIADMIPPAAPEAAAKPEPEPEAEQDTPAWMQALRQGVRE
nr:hypothetical protein [Bacilli bacterium]